MGVLGCLFRVVERDGWMEVGIFGNGVSIGCLEGGGGGGVYGGGLGRGRGDDGLIFFYRARFYVCYSELSK